MAEAAAGQVVGLSVASRLANKVVRAEAVAELVAGCSEGGRSEESTVAWEVECPVESVVA